MGSITLHFSNQPNFENRKSEKKEWRIKLIFVNTHFEGLLKPYHSIQSMRCNEQEYIVNMEDVYSGRL